MINSSSLETNAVKWAGTSLIGATLLASAILAPPNEVSAEPIATAITVKTSTTSELSGQRRELAAGGSLAQDEVIKTDRAGNASLRFIDDTSLTVGPASTIKLDKFVFNPDRKASEFVLGATRGVFRFATGHSEHRAYEIVTPVAVIGVRGTQFAFGLEGNRMTLVVTQGTVRSCTVNTPRRCVNAAAGNTIVATPSGAIVRRSTGNIPPLLRAVLVLPASRVRATQNRTRTIPASGGQNQPAGGIIGPGLLEQGQTLSPQGPRPTGTPLPTPSRGGNLR
jgi:hypothetical protein